MGQAQILLNQPKWCGLELASNVVDLTKAAIALHNYLQTEESSVYRSAGFEDVNDGSGNVINGCWREEDPSTVLTALGSFSVKRCTACKVNAHQFTSVLL